MSDEASIIVDRRAGFRIITLNRPQRLNAFNEGMHVALRAALDEAEADPECRALMLTGAGRAFCAGADISGGSGAFQVWNDGNKPQKRDPGDSITLAIFNCLKPIVAARCLICRILSMTS